MIEHDEVNELSSQPATDMAQRPSSDTQQSLRESEELFRTLYTNLPGGMVVIGRDYRIKNVNQRTCEITGYTREELVGSMCDIICPKGSESKMCPIWEIGQIGFEGMDTFVKTRELVMNPVLKNARRVMVNGEEHILEVFQDIREQKETEQALRKSEARLSSIFRAAPIGVGTFQGGLIHSVNDRFCEITGYDPEDVVGKRPSVLFPGVENFDELQQQFLSSLVGQCSVTREVQFKRKNGEIIYLLLSLARLETDESDDGVTFTILDITERRDAEAEREHLREQYFQVMKMESVGRLAGGIAHDLNNLLTPILGYGELLLLEGFPTIIMNHGDQTSQQPMLEDEGDPFEPLKQIVSAATRAKDLVRQLLAFSRKQALKFDRIDLNELIARFEKLLRRTIREDITIEKRLFPGKLISEGDFGQLEQVVMNLAVNAQDAMPNGGVLTIETGVIRLDSDSVISDDEFEPGWYNMLAVYDNGHGMDKETQQNIFEPFFTTKSVHKGTGLGLATVYGIVKQHGGAIAVESSPDAGAAFKVYLPVAENHEESEDPDAEEESDYCGAETILLVEDDKQVRFLAHSILKLHGYNVIDAVDGMDALEKLDALECPIDLLVTDVVMPEMNGKQLYERVARMQPGVPVLFMSGYSDDVIAQRGIMDSGVNYLHKPFTVQQLAAKVREALEG